MKDQSQKAKIWEPSGAAAGTLLPATQVRSSGGTPADSVPGSRLDQIRAAGRRLLFEHGYAGMTMRQIAAVLRIKAASLYYHFPSKQDILFDLMRTTASELLEGLRRIAASESGPERKLDEAIRWHVLFHTQKREEAFVSHSELRSLEAENLKEILKLRHEYDRLFDAILQQGRKDGRFEIEDVSVVRNSILTMCTATAGWFSPQGRLTAEQVADQICNFVRAGLFPRSGSRRTKAE